MIRAQSAPIKSLVLILDAAALKPKKRIAALPPFLCLGDCGGGVNRLTTYGRLAVRPMRAL